MSSRIRSGERGISRTRTPKGASASSTASATSAATGITPASPTPLTPSGFNGDGVSRWATSISGSSAVVVVHELLVERAADSLGHAAVDLPLNDHGIHHRSAVVLGDVLEEGELSGAEVDLDDRRVTAAGE